jgi:ATP-dependent RNA circularization protein (DNA/RNA ligase family)
MNKPLDGFFNKIWNKKEFIVCTHHTRNYDTNSDWWKVAKKYDIKNALLKYEKETGQNICVQGELLGPKICGNIYQLSDYDLYIFNAKNLNTGEYLGFEEIQEFCKKTGLKYVPIIEKDLIITADMTPKYFLDKSNGYSMLKSDVLREGIVVRTYDMKSSFKARSPEYLMAHDKN